jgi:lysophospholipase L1-like esterase
MRLVLIGDSIRLGYQGEVARLLAGSAEVVGPRQNCRSTADILEHLKPWVFDRLGSGATVHLNAGLHDLRRLEGPGTDPQVAIDAYEESLRRIVDAVIAHSGCERLILATTTPVDDERHAAMGCSNRHDADVERYNERLRVVAAGAAVDTHDLNALIRSDPGRHLSDDGVHLTAAGNAVAARSIAAFVAPAPTTGTDDA